MKENDYIRFDWAIKRILRDKANFAILEGLFSVLLGNILRPYRNIMASLPQSRPMQFS